jgi:hypothetical protein
MVVRQHARHLLVGDRAGVDVGPERTRMHDRRVGARERALGACDQVAQLTAPAGQLRARPPEDPLRDRRHPFAVAGDQRRHLGVRRLLRVLGPGDPAGLRHDVAGSPVHRDVHEVVCHAVRERLHDQLVAAAVPVREPEVEPRMAVPGDHHVHGRAHLARLLDDLAGEVRGVGFVLGRRAGMREHHDRLDAAPPQLRYPAIDRLRDIGELEWRRVPLEQELRRGRGRDADETHADAGPLDDLVGRQHQAAIAIPGVGRDVGEAREAEQAEQLLASLVELVVPDRADVEADVVRGLDRRLVLEVARYQRRRAHHVARVHANGSARNGCRVEVRLQPRCATDSGTRGLEMAVEVVHAEQAELHDPARLVRLGRGVGVRVET